MLGAVIGDIVGSCFEWNNYKGKDFKLFTEECHPTDDSVMTLAVAKAVLEFKAGGGNLSELAVRYMREIGVDYPDCGYGGRFYRWIFSTGEPRPYYSFGNGSAMRVSACGFAASSLEEAKSMACDVTCVTHDHPEGMKGAEATAAVIFLARDGKGLSAIRNHIDENYYPMNFSLDEIRPAYEYDVSCQGSVPQALMAFLESNSFEDAIRNAVSLGGDSDTIAAITGGVAEAYYGIPQKIREQAVGHLDATLRGILLDFEEKYPPKISRGMMDGVLRSIKGIFAF